MPWDELDHQAAVGGIIEGLQERARHDLEVDADARVVDALALENTGNRHYPRTRTPLTGGRLERAKVSGRYDRWATIVWRAEMAGVLSRRNARHASWSGGVPRPNRAQRRAAAKHRRRAR